MTKALIVLPHKVLEQKRMCCSMARAVQFSLGELDIESSIVSDRNGGVTDLLFTMWHCEIDLAKFTYKSSIHFTSEILPYRKDAPRRFKRRWKDIQHHFAKYDHIFEHSSCNVEFLSNAGYNVTHCPWGYVPIFDMQMTLDSQEDVLFIGTMTKRRRKIWRDLRSVKQSLCRFKSVVSWDGESKAITKAAISLNIHNNKVPVFEACRVVCLLLGNGAFVISEPYDDTVPLKDGQHLVIAEIGEFVERIEYYLAHPVERQQIAEQGHKFIQKHYTMTQNLQAALLEARLI